jgi:multiple antibiotic resistance protein
MTGLLPFALFSFSALLAIVDPIAVVPIFVALTPNDSRQRRQEMARRASFVAWGLLVFFAICGTAFFRLLGVTLSAFKVAGGILLLLTAIDQLRAQPARTRTTKEEQEAGTIKEDISVTPLALPLIAGPGSIATSVMLMSRAASLMEQAIVLLAITFAVACSFGALMMSERFARLLGAVGRTIVERLSGLVLSAIAMQFILDGVREALKG